MAIEKFINATFTGRTGHAKMCSKEEYLRVFVQVGTILRPGVDTDELAEIIRDDFENDCQPKKKPISTMNK